MSPNRHVALLAASLALGCDTGFAPIEIDVSSNCNRVEAHVVRSDFGADTRPWSRVWSILDSGPGIDAQWAVVQPENADRLEVWQWRNGELEHVVELPVPVAEASDLELRPGRRPSEAWLVWSAPGQFALWRLDDEEPGGLGAQSGSLGGFPPDVARCDEDGDGDPTDLCSVRDWSRHLAFVGGSAYIVALPDSSPDEETHVYLGALGSNLTPLQTTDLSFLPRCSFGSSGLCDEAEAGLRYPSLRFVDATDDGRQGRHAFVFFRDIASGAVRYPGSDVVLVVLRPGDEGMPSGVSVSLNEDLSGIVPIRSTTSGVAMDAASVYVQYAIDTGPDRLFRFSLLDYLPRQLELDIAPGMGLVQLDRDIALSRLTDDGRWEVLKLFPEAPEASETFVYEPSNPARRIDEAGLGSFVLRTDSGAIELVRLACAPPQ